MILTKLPIDVLAETNMLNTDGYTYLLDLIRFLCSFFTAPLWFGLSFLNLLVISYVAHFIIGICLGGIAPHTKIEKPIDRTSDNSSFIKPGTVVDRYGPYRGTDLIKR